MNTHPDQHSRSTPLRLKYVTKRPVPFPSIGEPAVRPEKQTPAYREEYTAFTAIFRDMREKYAHLRGELKKRIAEMDYWYDEIDFSSHPGDKRSAQSMFKKIKGKAEETINTMNTLTRHILSPYFGRIDFTFSKDAPARFKNKNMTFYIGKRGLQLPHIKITDWRAPISSIYYNFPQPTKECFYKTDKEMINGELTLKRKIDIEDGSLLQVLDGSEVTSLVGSDPFLMRQLNKGSSTRLKDIISTIQAEQNTIISMEPEKDIVVAGVAGSGKTSIAVHRLSWLLYNYRDIQPHRCLILGPSKLFLHYIADILPETGSENVPQTTYADWAQQKLKGIMDTSTLAENDPRAREKSVMHFMKTMIPLSQTLKGNTAIKSNPSLLITKYLSHLKQKSLTSWDLPPLIYLKSLVFDMLPSEKLQYTVLDEVQDRTPAEIFTLKRYTEKGRFLAVGDLLQGIANPLGLSSWETLFDGILKQKETEQYTIRTSYRSTKEIIEYVNDLLLKEDVPGYLLPRPVLRNGPKPSVFEDMSLEETLSTIPQLIRDEAAMGRRNIAIIVPEKHLSLFSNDLSRNVPKLITISKNDQLYDGGVLLSYIKLLKGLEFDSVIFVNVEEGDEHKLELRKFYTSCTRAMHKLYVMQIAA